MTSFPNLPKLLKGGIVLIDPDNSAVLRIIALQYNPDSLSRTLQIKELAEGADRSDVMRLTGPPVETIKLEAEIDATDQPETVHSRHAPGSSTCHSFWSERGLANKGKKYLRIESGGKYE